MEIKLSNYYLKKCQDFANARIDGSKQLYAYRGESNIEKMKEDIVVGLMAEWGCYKWLKSLGLNPSKPDMKIYEGRRKSYSADIFCNDLRIHVKSQSEKSSARYGLSWLGQKTDKLWSSPDNQDLVFFAQVSGNVVKILGMVSAKDIVENDLLKEPKVPKYRHSKVAIYWDNIAESSINIRSSL